MLGLGIGITSLSSRGGGATPFVPVLRHIGNNSMVMRAAGATVAATSEKKRFYQRVVTAAGAKTIEMPVYPGYWFNGATKTNYTANITLKAHVDCPTAPGTKCHVFTWDGGASSGTLTPGHAGYKPDPKALTPASFGIAPVGAGDDEFPEGTVLYILHVYETTAGNILPGNGSQQSTPAVGNEACQTAPAGTADGIGTTGTPAASGGWTASLHRPHCAAVLGYARQGFVSVALAGDSQHTEGDHTSDGASGTESTRRGGYSRRALSDLNTATPKVIAHAMLAIPGDTAATFNGAGDPRKELLQYFTHVYCNYGINGPGTIAQLRTLWEDAKTRGIQHVAQAFITPRAALGGTYSTLAGQTVHGSNAAYVQLNSDIAANVGANGLDEVVDLNTGILAHASNARLWNVADGTYTSGYTAGQQSHDGLHMTGSSSSPTGPGHLNAAIKLRSVAVTWTADA